MHTYFFIFRYSIVHKTPTVASFSHTELSTELVAIANHGNMAYFRWASHAYIVAEIIMIISSKS